MAYPTGQTIWRKSHNHRDCIERTLQIAERICREKGLRLTQIRRHVLELVSDNHKAVGAYELLDLMRQKNPNAKPATVYRALDFLIESGLVHKIESLNAFIACLHAESRHQSAILICDQCQNAYEIEAADIYEKLFSMSEAVRFKPRWLTLELHGLCADCQNGQ